MMFVQFVRNGIGRETWDIHSPDDFEGENGKRLLSFLACVCRDEMERQRHEDEDRQIWQRKQERAAR